MRFRRLLPAAVAVLATALGLALATPPAGAQFFNERDDKYVLLGLKRAKQAFDVARADHQRKQDLFDQGFLSKEELDQAARALSEAEVNYQQSLLAVVFSEQYVAVRGAVKQRDAAGRARVRLTLENTAAGGAELHQLTGVEDELFRALAPDRVRDVYVSLLDDSNAIVSQPYETKIGELATGAPATVDLGLLRDLDAVTVAITYGNGSRRQVKVFLQRDVREDRLAIQPLQFSQEGELGGTVTYDLELELYSGANDTYRLAVANLPPEIHASFSDPASSARLRQIHFDGTAGTRRARLALELPDRPSPELALGKARELFVLAVPAGREAAIGDLETRVWTTAALTAAGLSFARLELVPRGVGKLRVDAPQLFHRVEGGMPVRVVIDLKNDGSGELRNVEPRLDTPLGWTRAVEPPLVASLGVGEERRLTLTLTPPADVAPGRYETRIESQALADGKPVDGDDKVVTIEISAPVNLFGTALLIVLILAAIGGLVAFGIRLTKR
ncbi:MAG: NEW3 domain-containing protein [Thermoanaerobaculia bacterium]